MISKQSTATNLLCVRMMAIVLLTFLFWLLLRVLNLSSKREILMRAHLILIQPSRKFIAELCPKD